MPKLIRLYIASIAVGFALSVVFAALLMWFDIGGLNGLVLGSDAGWIAAVMLVLSNGILFAGAQFGIRVMMMADADDIPRGGHRHGRMIPIPVRAEARAKPGLPRRRQ